MSDDDQQPTPAPWPGWTGLRKLGDHGEHRGQDRERDKGNQ